MKTQIRTSLRVARVTHVVETFLAGLSVVGHESYTKLSAKVRGQAPGTIKLGFFHVNRVAEDGEQPPIRNLRRDWAKLLIPDAMKEEEGEE